MPENPKINPRRELKAKAAKAKASKNPDPPKKPAKPADAKAASAQFNRKFPEVAPRKVQLSKLVADVAQMRGRMDSRSIEQYKDDYEEKRPIPPIFVFEDADGTLRIADGHYRFEAAKLANFRTIDAIVHPGTLRDAVAYAVGANDSHGVPRDTQTKRNAVETLLGDPEWSKMSTAMIAEATRVRHPTVKVIRDEWNAKHGKAPGSVVTKDGKTRAAKATPPKLPAKREAGSDDDTNTAPTSVQPAGTRMSDEEYLETLPVRKELSSVALKQFDLDSLRNRAIVESHEYQTLKRLATSILDLKGQPSPGYLYRELIAIIRLHHPREAKVCIGCGGKGATKTGPCGDCDANGYRLV